MTAVQIERMIEDVRMTRKHFTLPVAVHLFLIQDGAVLLLRRANTGYEDGNYSVIAGHIDGGEPLTLAMSREAREEAGIEIAPSDIEVVGTMHQHDPFEEYIDFFLTARRWQGEIHNREPHKCSELAWYSLDRLPPNVIPYVRQALDNYRRGIWFDSFGW